MTAEQIAEVLGGRKAGAVWMARCPAHDDRCPSLVIADANGGKVLVHCHAGCDQRNVIAALQARGAWEWTGQGTDRSLPRTDRTAPAKPDRDAIERTEIALTPWRGSDLAEATLV